MVLIAYVVAASTTAPRGEVMGSITETQALLLPQAQP